MTFELMGHVAKSDGRVTESEIDAARQLMRELKLGPREISMAIDCFRTGKSTAYDAELGIERSQVARHVDLLACSQLHPDQAVPFLAGQRHQAVFGPVQFGKSLLAGQPDQAARVVVGPGVVRAGEAPRVAAALGRLAAAVTAVVEERPDDTVAVAAHEHRGPEDLAHQVVVGLGQLGTDRQRQWRVAAELALTLEEILVPVVAEWDRQQCVGHLGGTGIDQAQCPTHELGTDGKCRGCRLRAGHR